MKPKLVWLESNEAHAADGPSNHAERDPTDDFGWFTIGVGMEADPASTIFQVVVSTPKAIPRAKHKKQTKFRGLVIPAYSSESAHEAIKQRVETARVLTWDDLISDLQREMHWEYE